MLLWGFSRAALPGVRWIVPALAILAASGLQQGGGSSQTGTASAATQACTIRFDGIYERQTYGFNYYLRFYPNGVVADQFGRREEVVNSLVQFGPAPQTGRFRVDGCRILITGNKPWTEDRSGSIEGDRLKFREANPNLIPPQVAEEYVFVPVDFAAFENHQKEQRAAVTKRMQQEAQMAPKPELNVEIGTAKVTGQCSKVEFTPLRGPVRLPAGTGKIVYQISGARSDVTIQMVGLCPTGKTTNETCTEYAIQWGQPVPVRWTTTFSCADGRPFRPGTYTLKALSQGRPVKTIPFTVP